MGRSNSRFDQQPSSWQQNTQSTRRRRVILLALIIVLILYCTTSWFHLDNRAHLQSIAKYHPHDTTADSDSSTNSLPSSDDAVMKSTPEDDDKTLITIPSSDSAAEDALEATEEPPAKEASQDQLEDAEEAAESQSGTSMKTQPADQPPVALDNRPAFLEAEPEEAADDEVEDESDE